MNADFQNVDTQNELDLLAFRYIADELADDEREAFELRLAEDQSAREAVARAVELSQVTLAAFESIEHSPAIVAPRESGFAAWYARIAWMTSGAIACLLALIGYQMMSAPKGHGSSAPTAEVARLAHAWSDAQESIREVAAGAGETGEENHDAGSSEVSPLATDDMGETPSWMLAAVGVETSEENEEAESLAPSIDPGH